MKRELVGWLTEAGHEVTDMGAAELMEGDDYPDYARPVAQAVAADPAARGILLCGTGVGMAVAANKVRGIRAALMHDPPLAAAAQHDDSINVLALGSDYISLEKAQEVITQWLTTQFSGEERHQRRIDKISQFEQNTR